MPDSKTSVELKVLLVEDNVTILNVHKTFLNRIGLIVDTAITGEQALKKFQEYHYPLVLLDGGLAGTDVKELAIQMRELEKNTVRLRTSFIILSGYSEELINNWCGTTDINAYAIKPVHPKFLEQLILHYI